MSESPQIVLEEVKERKKNTSFSSVNGYELKEIADNLIVSGYIATTHLDSGWYDSEHGKLVRDKITKETLIKWADEINNGNPRANKVSVNHNREPHVTGVGIKGSARVDVVGRDKDGSIAHGLYVDTLIDKTKTGFDELKYRIDNNLLDSFSIEYDTGLITNGKYYENAVREFNKGDYIERWLLPETTLAGWTLASQPMNEYAVMLKEIREMDTKEKTPEVMESKEETTMPEVEVKEKAEELTVSAGDYKILQEVKEAREKEAKEMESKEIVKRVKEELKEALQNMEVKNKVLSKENDHVESKEFIEYKELLSGKLGNDRQWKLAGKLATMDMWMKGSGRSAEMKSQSGYFDNKFSINNNKLEYKGLGITTNQNTDTDYLLSSAELSDVFDPVIYNALNQVTNTWNVLQKDDFSGKGNDKVQFSLKTAANSTATAYAGNAVATGNVTRLKYQTKFKKYQVGVEVDGDMIAAARGGPIGDVFAQEVADSTDDLMSVINLALYAEVGLETATGVIGFEFICDSAGNTTMYNLSRSAANRLTPDAAGNTYINGNSAKVSKTNLRAAIRNAIEEGAQLQNLVFFVSPIQYDMIKSIYDDAQRLVPTSSKFGFTGLMEFDGVPVFYDKDCNDDDIFLVDLETHRVAIWIPPTLEKLGKDSDSEKGFIKTYFATYNRAPRRMAMIYGNATS